MHKEVQAQKTITQLFLSQTVKQIMYQPVHPEAAVVRPLPRNEITQLQKAPPTEVVEDKVCVSLVSLMSTL